MPIYVYREGRIYICVVVIFYLNFCYYYYYFIKKDRYISIFSVSDLVTDSFQIQKNLLRLNLVRSDPFLLTSSELIC